jgi:hypothetical protein
MEASMIYFIVGVVVGGTIVPFGLFCYALMHEGEW